MSLRLDYLTGQYPRVTDTFIRREVATLRAQGHHVQTFSVREPAQSDQVSESFAPEKGSFMLLEAVPQLSDVTLDVVGDGALLASLRERFCPAPNGGDPALRLVRLRLDRDAQC